MLVEGYIALGFGLSIVLFFVGQGCRLVLDVIDIMTAR